MDTDLSDVEVRVLGSLIEKELSTPEYYPLSLNVLTNACNQKTNRDPVVSYDEAAVERALNSLREKGLGRLIYASGSRVAKYGHSLLDRFDLSREETAVLCELMLRGPQTPGEIRARSGRMAVLGEIGKVENILSGLAETAEPLVARLPKEAGRKENRYVHLFSGQPEMTDEKTDEGPAQDEAARLTRLEQEVSELRREVEDLKKAFSELRSGS
jgi:uncharacterized protein YceH (UPF0502 family)